MKIAIIGAGLSGLACAHELEIHNIEYDIYEHYSSIGEPYTHVSTILEIIQRPINNCIEYLSNNFNISLKPINKVNKVIHYSANKSFTISGNLGYFFERSQVIDLDIKNQIYSSLKKANILFSTHGDYLPLSKQYDYVVIANGNESFTDENGCWMERVNTYVCGATVLGNFDPNTLLVWFNKNYCKNGYAYLTPFNNKRACIVLVVTDVNEKEIDFYWDLFLSVENIKYTIVEQFKLPHKSGHVYPHKVNNLFFVGNAGGAIEPALGFGVTNSIISGVMAARSIAHGLDYDKLMDNIISKKNSQLYEFRKLLNTFSNPTYDMLIEMLGLPIINQLIYKTPLNVVKVGASVLKNINKIHLH